MKEVDCTHYEQMVSASGFDAMALVGPVVPPAEGVPSVLTVAEGETGAAAAPQS
ncbi:hypothetical protein D3C81_2288660 [compost metagenome]